MLSLEDKEFILKFIKTNGQNQIIKLSHHRYLWFKCSGAYNQMNNNPGYYEMLKKHSLIYPNPLQQQIELDLKRTYPDELDVEKLENDIIPLRNVLNAYVQRCPSIGYC